VVLYELHLIMDFAKCANFTAAARSAPDMVSSPLLPRHSIAAAAATSAYANSRAAASANAVASESALARTAACAFMATLELKVVASQKIHRFFELMVPSRTSSAIFISSVDGRVTCVWVGTEPANLLLKPASARVTWLFFLRGGERLELSRIRALAASHGPGVGVLQASQRQRIFPDFPPRDLNVRLAEGEEIGALFDGIAVPAV